MPSRRGRDAKRVVLTPVAAIDLDEAFGYIDARNRAAARELLASLRAAFARLAEFPGVGVALSAEEFPALEPGIHYIVVESYVAFYRETADSVVVLRVLHARRDFLAEFLGS